MADNKKKDINEVVRNIEELTDKQLEKVAGGVKKTCPAGQVLVGNKCEKKKKP
ncbi:MULTISPECIES: bacteriocin [unclassified Butyrivibrio]|uniref:bacteriocin n=1 Tax=unclassified Butyrivibrio TaxID=2639466 RepID=UPI0003FCCF31|nr:MULTISPECIES: bacteriocin [unclassified Butyrivibrio]